MPHTVHHAYAGSEGTQGGRVAHHGRMRLPSQRDIPPMTEFRGRTFDARPATDDQSLNYPVRLVLPGMVTPVRKVWRRGAVLDQGPDGACVGHGWAAEASGTPARVDFATIDRYGDDPPAPLNVHGAAHWLYRAAQRVDQWPGEDYSGTSVLAGAKVMQSLGLMDGYRWAFTRLDMRDTLMTFGPVVIAIPWLDGMFDAPGGELTVEGDEVGWHCVLVNGIDPHLSIGGKPPREMVRVQNSWGTSFGVYGSAWVDMQALWALIEGRDGDVCVPVGRRLPSA